MKNVIWIIFNCTLIFNLITTSSSIKNEEELIVYQKSFNSSILESPHVNIILCYYYKYIIIII